MRMVRSIHMLRSAINRRREIEKEEEGSSSYKGDYLGV